MITRGAAYIYIYRSVPTDLYICGNPSNHQNHFSLANLFALNHVTIWKSTGEYKISIAKKKNLTQMGNGNKQWPTRRCTNVIYLNGIWNLWEQVTWFSQWPMSMKFTVSGKHAIYHHLKFVKGPFLAVIQSLRNFAAGWRKKADL